MKLLTPLFQSMCGFLYYTSKHCQSYKPRVVLHSKDNYLYVSRLCNMCKNKITNTNPRCAYCKGYGYTRCPYCINGCIICTYSTLSPCRFCLGDRKGRFAYREIKK